jgi:RNA polymerase sigma-70 factor (ECF subfamily)
MSGQAAQNLVYWPQKSLNSEPTTMPPEPSNRDDLQKWKTHLIAVAERQDKDAFHALYCFFAPKLKSFYSQNGFYSQAEEMVQEVFIRVWNRAPTYDASKSAVSTWIYTIARNYRIDVLRKKQLTIADEETIPESGYQQDMEEELNLDRGGMELKDAIANLNNEQRMVIQKVYFEDKSHQIAAEELGMTLGVVKSRIRSALKLMKKQIGDDWL